MTEPTDNLVLNIIFEKVSLNHYQRQQIAEELAKIAGHPIEAHRITRGNAGGKYKLKNIMWISPAKHAELHQGELMGRRG